MDFYYFSNPGEGHLSHVGLYLVYVGPVDYKCQVERQATLFNTFAMTLPSGSLPT